MKSLKIKSKYKGILLIILSAFFFALMSFFVRLSGDLPSIQKSFFRNAVSLVVALAILLKERTGFKIGKGNLPWLILRATCGTIGIFGNFYAVDKLNLADASILNKMSPFFVIIFSYFLLKEKVSLKQALIVFMAFVGSLFVIKPSFSNVNLFPASMGLLSGIAAGAAYAVVRKLSTRGVAGPVIVFFFSAFSCAACVPFMIVEYKSMTFIQLMYLLLAGASAAAGQFAITAAYSHSPAKEISVYDYSQIIFSTSLGFIFLGEVPDIYSFIGYFIIISAAVLMFFINRNSGTEKMSKKTV